MGIIYKATNKLNNNVYIGKTIFDLDNRKKNHLSFANMNSKFYFHRAIRKYGFDAFEWEILTETDSESKLNALEKFYIAAYRKMGKLYNMTDGGEGTRGRIVREETRKKISESNKGQIPWITGKHLSEAHKQKLSESKTNPPEETRIKMRSASKGRNLGRRLTDEHKHKIIASLKCRLISDETRKKLSLSKIGDKNPRFKKEPWNKGKTGVYNQETRERISLSLKKHYNKIINNYE